MNANNSHDANPVARDSAAAPVVDHTIDRALSTLRDAQPRSGLEGRILVSLEHRTAIAHPSRFQLSAHIALWTAASVAIVATSLIILHRHSAPAKLPVASQSSSEPTTNVVILSEASRSDAQSKDSDTARRTTVVKPFSTPYLARIKNTPSSRPEHRSLTAMRSGETRISDRQDASAITPTDAQALADLYAPSHPAPPLSLTPQEKLLLHVLRYGNLTQLAELNPIVRAKRDADETTAFKAFFPDPPPLKQPTGDAE